MRSWFSQLFAQATEQGRNAIRLALTFIVAAFLAVLIFAYVAVQSGSWQAYVVVAAFLGFFALEIFVIKFAQLNQLNKSGILLVVAVCYVVLAMTTFMSGIGLGLSIALTLVIVEIAFETLSGKLAHGARISGLAFAITIVFMDKFAWWSRPSFPAVQYAIPIIAAGTVIAIAFLMLGRFVTWRDISLARKLLISFSLLAFLALAVGVISLLGLTRVQNSFQTALSEGAALQETSQHMGADLLTARLHEKDFLLRWQDQGFGTAYANYVFPNQAVLVEMRNHNKELLAFASAVEQDQAHSYTEAQYKADLITLYDSTNLYEQNFRWTVQLIQERGFQNTGLEGQLREDAHNIEDRIYDREGLEPLVITLLQIRRREKDYLLRADQEYVDNVHTLAIQLKGQIATSDRLGATEKSEMIALANQYIDSFNALVGKNAEIAVATDAFREAALTMEPIVAKIATTGESLSLQEVQAAEIESTRTLLFSSLTVTIALLIAIFLSVTLSRQITQPVRVLTAAAHELEIGNYDSHAEVMSGDELGTLAGAFNSMAKQLKQSVAFVTKRAADLQTVAEVSSSTSTVLDTEKLLWNVSNLTKERFGLYHAHIYMLNEAEDTLILVAGAGDAGRQMVSEGRSIPIDREQSLVARAAREHKGVIVNDVRSASDFLPHPLLPDTRSELAVPMIVNDKVIGVFDVQSDVVNQFTQENANIQTIMAAQIAVAVQNARSYVEVQARAEREALIASIGQKIQNTSSVESALQVAIRELGRAVGQETIVRLYTRQNGN